MRDGRHQHREHAAEEEPARGPRDRVRTRAVALVAVVAGGRGGHRREHPVDLPRRAGEVRVHDASGEASVGPRRREVQGGRAGAAHRGPCGRRSRCRSRQFATRRPQVPSSSAQESVATCRTELIAVISRRRRRRRSRIVIPQLRVRRLDVEASAGQGGVERDPLGRRRLWETGDRIDVRALGLVLLGRDAHAGRDAVER